MKNTKSTLYILGSALLVTGCQVRVPSVKTPAPDYYGGIEQNMVINGYPKDALCHGLLFLTDQRILPS